MRNYLKSNSTKKYPGEDVEYYIDPFFYKNYDHKKDEENEKRNKM